MARPLPKRWIAIVAGVALVALIVAAVVLSTRDDGASSAGGTATGTVDATGSVTGTATAAGTPQPPGTSGDPSGALPSGTTGGTDGSGASGTHLPPTAPAPDGAALTTVTAPPAQTLAMIDATRATAESTYDVTFQVYGYGPGGAQSSLVISVKRSSPIKQVEKAYDFTGRNVLVRLGPTGSGAIAVGGTYRGTITLKPDGSVLVPVLSDVRKDS